MTELDAYEPKTEEEALESNEKIKRALRWSVVFWTPVAALLLWIFSPPYWGAILLAFFLIELASLPFWTRLIDRSTEQQIAAIRESRGGF